MAYYGTIVGKKSQTENLIGRIHTCYTQYIEYPEYTGAYVATPTSSKQTFQTADKKMNENFRVNATPYKTASNSAGGYTVTIL